MFHKLALTLSAASLAVAPVAAQAAPARVGTPVAGESEELAGGFFLPAVIAIGFIIAIWLAIDSEKDIDVPFSP
jgi:hypothetical protein